MISVYLLPDYKGSIPVFTEYLLFIYSLKEKTSGFACKEYNVTLLYPKVVQTLGYNKDPSL